MGWKGREGKRKEKKRRDESKEGKMDWNVLDGWDKKPWEDVNGNDDGDFSGKSSMAMTLVVECFSWEDAGGLGASL